jgi:hypothetical protein
MESVSQIIGINVLHHAENYLIHGDYVTTYRTCGEAEFDMEGHCDFCEHEIVALRSVIDAVRILHKLRKEIEFA